MEKKKMFSSICKKERQEYIKCISKPSSWYPGKCSPFFSEWKKCAKTAVHAWDEEHAAAQAQVDAYAKAQAEAQAKAQAEAHAKAEMKRKTRTEERKTMTEARVNSTSNSRNLGIGFDYTTMKWTLGLGENGINSPGGLDIDEKYTPYRY
jgi:hypothetical protein